MVHPLTAMEQTAGRVPDLVRRIANLEVALEYIATRSTKDWSVRDDARELHAFITDLQSTAKMALEREPLDP